ncbi:ABC transporter ATP-binding protein [Mycetocola sp. JXN-3]|uniref:ABC transporter ATP-binding protein n=1 Tax=Mycetocola sp. JXN-3 TaxID=2116510 RepID=UPI00165D1BEB|nr:ABC transporter ATP-binding protein [Mycetocola sp. JXN-3]
MTRPVVVELKDVSKKFIIRKDNSLKERIVTLGRNGKQHREEFWALKDLGFSIEAGTTVGLIGHNGSGKSTLLKVIGSIIEPTSGTVARRGRIAALLELGAGFHPDLTGRENVYLNAAIMGMSQEETEEKFDRIVSFSGIPDFIDTQVKFYSSGMYVRLAFAVAIHTDPDILLVDEVLAVGDEAFQRKCLDKIREFQREGRTIILVTHNLGQVNDLCDRAILMNKGVMEYDGDTHEAISRFRDILEDRRVDDIAREVEEGFAEEAPPTGKISDCTLTLADGSPATMVPVGSDLILEATIEHETPLEGWYVGIQVDNHMGTPLFGTETRMLAKNLPPLQEARRLRFAIKDVPFGEGKFFINVSLMDASGRHVYDAVQACSFNAPAPEFSRCSIVIDSEFTDLGPVSPAR